MMRLRRSSRNTQILGLSGTIGITASEPYSIAVKDDAGFAHGAGLIHAATCYILAFEKVTDQCFPSVHAGTLDIVNTRDEKTTVGISSIAGGGGCGGGELSPFAYTHSGNTAINSL